MEVTKMDLNLSASGTGDVEREHLIGRSWLGGLSICFDGGCSYPSMVTLLEAVFKRYGRLVRFGESLSAQAWMDRVEACGFQVSAQERLAVLTLMHGH